MKIYKCLLFLGAIHIVFGWVGIAYAEKDSSELVLSDYSRPIRLKLSDAEANTYYRRGIVYAKGGNLDHAIAHFSKAIEINSNAVDAYYGRGTANRV